MGRLPSTRFVFGAFILIAVIEATDPARAQNINDLLTIFGGEKQRAARQAQVEWRRLPPAEMAFIDQRLRRKGSSVEALVRRGVKPSAVRLIELRSSCRQFVEGVQTDTAPGLARDATGSPTPTVPPSNPTEQNDAGVTLPSSAESPKDAGVTLSSSAESAGRVAEEQAQQGNVEPKDSLPESRVARSSAAFLVAVIAIAALLGIVIYLFIRWRNTGQRTVSASATSPIPNKNLEGGEEKAPLETTIGETGEVMPLAEKLPDQKGQGAAISISQNSACSSKIESTNEEVFPDIVVIELSELSTTDSSAVENVAQLAKLYAMGTPSEKEFQRLKGLISHS
jgi:hypothetical protein